mmetsp:Transcript_38763/g.153141  ORF Transcript_38763/g.153141 Transcript_38763/m.153141 type:complete len:98 (-) Transcript_38763:3-296(-)
MKARTYADETDVSSFTCTKVMFATNVAETSITIRNVKYVIDTGVAKSRTVNLKTGADILRVGPVSKSQARQRAGRAGRESQGLGTSNSSCVFVSPQE